MKGERVARTAGKRDTTRSTRPGDGSNRNAIKRAAASMFSQRGYYATSLRDIAKKVGVTLGTIYHYFPSKEDLLAELIDDAMVPLMETVDQIDGRLATDPPSTVLAWMVEVFILGTLERLGTAMVADVELRALTGRSHSRAIGQRDAYQEAMERVVEAGVERGEFEVQDLKLAVYAILSACNGVPRWYRPGGRVPDEEIARRYAQIALRIVGHRS